METRSGRRSSASGSFTQHFKDGRSRQWKFLNWDVGGQEFYAINSKGSCRVLRPVGLTRGATTYPAKDVVGIQEVQTARRAWAILISWLTEPERLALDAHVERINEGNAAERLKRKRSREDTQVLNAAYGPPLTIQLLVDGYASGILERFFREKGRESWLQFVHLRHMLRRKVKWRLDLNGGEAFFISDLLENTPPGPPPPDSKATTGDTINDQRVVHLRDGRTLMATPAQGAMFAALKKANGNLLTHAALAEAVDASRGGQSVTNLRPRPLFKNGPNKNELLKLLEFLRGAVRLKVELLADDW